MTYTKKSYNLLPGLTGFIDPELLYVDILSVDREGTGYEVVTASPSDREAQYDETNGTIRFRDEGIDLSGVSATFARYEKVNVIFKYT